ncbi:hypothetical protein [Kitasatospora sp. NPDC058478]|uniref:hypothetical protein n=1 Tax=unclassified Kitasatospora TaxID=2633591 RepID=UPI0036654550
MTVTITISITATMTPPRTAAEELAFVPEQHVTRVASLIIGHSASPDLVDRAVTVAWARRPPVMRGLDLGRYLDTARHFHYDVLFHAALDLDGDLRSVSALAAVVETVLEGNPYLRR